MFQKLARINRSAWFWSGLFLLGLGMELGALFYQYVLDYYPCVLCVQVRAWVMGVMLAGLAGLWLRLHPVGLILANLLGLAASLGMLERSYQTLGTEMGFVEGSCSLLDAAFPAFLPLDTWWPAVFKPLESCGYTPWIIPELLSMAEILMVIAVALVLLFVIMLPASFIAAVKPPMPGH